MGPDEDREIHHTERVYELLLDPLGQRRFVPDQPSSTADSSPCE